MVVNQFFDLLTTRFTAKKSGLQVGIPWPPHNTMMYFGLDGDRGGRLRCSRTSRYSSSRKFLLDYSESPGSTSLNFHPIGTDSVTRQRAGSVLGRLERRGGAHSLLICLAGQLLRHAFQAALLLVKVVQGEAAKDQQGHDHGCQSAEHVIAAIQAPLARLIWSRMAWLDNTGLVRPEKPSRLHHA